MSAANGAAAGPPLAAGAPSPPTPGVRQRVSYFYDHDVGNYSYGYGHPMKPHRMRMANNLIQNYGLYQHMQVLRPARATPAVLTRFHTDEYIDFLQHCSPETVEALSLNGTRYLQGDDCPGFEGLYEFCTISAGGSVSAAAKLNQGSSDICINWGGGLHHAKKREASGFCYVNDIVLAVLELLKVHPRVLYIDIDVHHGDGVEEAFYSTNRVMTCSFHKYGDFFPGTGHVDDMGVRRGKGYAVNVPLRDGISDESYGFIFREVIGHIIAWFRPGAIVLQCGTDSLAGDKLGSFNLSMQGHSDCVRFVKSFGIPMMTVGGGGYTIRNVARTWTNETGVLCNKELDENLPYNQYMEYFGPEYKLDVPRNSMTDNNTRDYLDSIRVQILEHLKNMPFAPGVQLRPLLDAGSGNAMVEYSDDEDSDLDVRISKRLRDRHVVRANNELSDSEEDELPMARSVPAQGQGVGPQQNDALKPGQAAFGLAPPPANGGIRNGSHATPSTRYDTLPSGPQPPSMRNPERLQHDLASAYTAPAMQEDKPRRKRPKRYFFVADAGPRSQLLREREGALFGLAAARKQADFFSQQGSPLTSLGPIVRSAEPVAPLDSSCVSRARSGNPIWDGSPILSDAEP